MEINFCIRVENERAADVLDAVRAVEDEGFGGVSFSDELMDLSMGGGWSHDPWTLMAVAAAVTEQITIGSMVFNVANRDAGTTAVAAATLQEIAGGRLWMGLGAGTNDGEVYSRDQMAFGRRPAPPAERRASVRAYIAELHRIWAHDHFLQPEPVPPLFFGAFGPLAAKLAGRHADGIAAAVDGYGDAAPGIEQLVDIARGARADAGRAGDVRIIAHTGPDDDASDPEWRAGSAGYDRLEALGAERLVLFIPPRVEAVRAAARYLPRTV
ncbi:LLM class flavin-dependent oxidoreductase [Agromyces bracchium]|uniref:LLM class flavin-dependent oxidoreductase n=1 Tax=Agromyces bracchium TaxID=88376 RepID=A0A6I3M4D8_9MICO|nr:LLM class flavin-dependent oxidoreductase [Agromyces bracchium]MTH69450.1 LLM class flavin-dependent oxidoreductase [Agromyces bracchium]